MYPMIGIAVSDENVTFVCGFDLAARSRGSHAHNVRYLMRLCQICVRNGFLTIFFSMSTLRTK